MLLEKWYVSEQDEMMISEAAYDVQAVVTIAGQRVIFGEVQK